VRIEGGRKELRPNEAMRGMKQKEEGYCGRVEGGGESGRSGRGQEGLL
jgi:hypothetical protein